MKSFNALIATLAAGSVHAFWRMECPGRTGLARLDPIVSPGAPSSHAHAVHGSSGFSSTSLTKDLQAGSCTSCLVAQDKSAYWHPALYFEDAGTGTYELVEQNGGLLSYYLLEGKSVTAFPKDFRMISGDNSRRRYTAGNYKEPDPPQSQWESLGQTTQGILAQRAVGFRCLNYMESPEASLSRHYLPDKAYIDANCPNGVLIELAFPSCWNGKDLDSKNHADHVAFSTFITSGSCPKGFDFRLPTLMYEVIWNTDAFSKRRGRFVLANGDFTGFSYHGDFVTGWNTTLLQSAIETCTSNTGRITDCPLFEIISDSKAKQCAFKVPQDLANEDVKGPRKLLPGGIKGER